MEAVKLTMILHTALQRQQNINLMLDSQKAPNISSSWVSYGVYILGILDKLTLL